MKDRRDAGMPAEISTSRSATIACMHCNLLLGPKNGLSPSQRSNRACRAPPCIHGRLRPPRDHRPSSSVVGLRRGHDGGEDAGLVHGMGLRPGGLRCLRAAAAGRGLQRRHYSHRRWCDSERCSRLPSEEASQGRRCSHHQAQLDDHALRLLPNRVHGKVPPVPRSRLPRRARPPAGP